MKKAHNRALSVARETIRHLTVELPRAALQHVNGGSGKTSPATTQLSEVDGSR